MKKNLNALTVTRKTGNERFRSGTQPIDFDLLSFWQWSGSDLSNNAFRGMLAEYIVACDFGAQNDLRTEWDAYDLITSKGIKVEVKSAAYIQSWQQKKLSAISFKICPTVGWDAKTNTYSPERKRQADVYVFCLLHHQDKSTIDPLDLSQWTFYILPTATLNEKLPERKTLGLARLLQLSPLKVEFGNIQEGIHTLFGV
jgi:hypothetical protein